LGVRYEAATVSEQDLAGAPDAEIVAVAAAEARILITLDKGIANLVRHPTSTHRGVVLFRPGSLGRRSVVEFVSDRLPALLDLPLEGKITVVTDRGILSR
jgi:predicted nuclease of predicted toxin-antitoxin system